MSTNIVDIEGLQMTSQHGAYESRAGLARLYARMRMHTPTHPGTNMHARTRAQACTHSPICDTAFPQQQWLRERASMLRYTYIGCLVLFVFVACHYFTQDEMENVSRHFEKLSELYPTVH
jgi:hypothetical protein